MEAKHLPSLPKEPIDETHCLVHYFIDVLLILI